MAALPLLAPSPTAPLLAPPAAAGLVLVLPLASPDDMRGFLIRFARFHQITEREGLSLSEAASFQAKNATGRTEYCLFDLNQIT